jgi:hypothetical protein
MSAAGTYIVKQYDRPVHVCDDAVDILKVIRVARATFTRFDLRLRKYQGGTT